MQKPSCFQAARRTVFFHVVRLPVSGAGERHFRHHAGHFDVSSYFDPLTKLIYAVGAVVGLIGGIKVYQKFSSGDPDTSKTAASWFGACIFLVIAGTVLRSFFL